jgi:CYTH domain-containing protein
MAVMENKKNANLEIEARFLVCGDSWRGLGDSVEILQGYLSTSKEMVLRLRLQDGKAEMTIKGETKGLTRREYEFILKDAEKAKEVIYTFCRHPIEKIRHRIRHQGFEWEIDEFQGENQGLVIAEVEFEREEDYQRMMAQDKPPWIGKEITKGHWQYTNMKLAERPFAQWRPEEKQDMDELLTDNSMTVIQHESTDLDSTGQ